MSTELRQQTIPASGELVVSQTANFLFLLSATIAVDVRFQEGGTTYGAVGVSAGYVKGKVKPWDRAVFKGTAGTVVSYFIGTEELREDITDFRQQIATIAGIVKITEEPAATLNTSLTSSIANLAALSVVANLSRKRITLSALSTNTGSVFVQSPGAGANIGIELQPGMTLEIKGTYAFDVRNDSGAAQVVNRFEEQ